MSPRVGLDTDTIVKAAIVMADSEGIDAVTIASLAKHLNIRPPSLYNHISGLEEVKKEVGIYGLEQLYERIAAAAANKSGDDAIKAISLAYVSYVRSHPGLYDATVQVPDLRDPDVQKVGEKIVNLVVQSFANYHLSKEDAIHAVRGLRSILHGFSALEQSNGFGLPLNVDLSLNFIIDTFLKGIHTMEGKSEK
ncbi:TetR/AcrR family transcriptional regulator [Alkalihalobacterium chitinilyticum]|uniref:TetR/AcrR family transcriptional regulator n=1 Tax=Alkalihalobacterium chitinilyticum TaxID=2980103 RepID=A0ABT5VJT7_9BACI|nr:TetR-like C-terminal domain-containing protein [Alkalihalobacterium chitinilyticum]MDE5415713.1 TetR/AcrR family transcriptional regulator [Alkalihalobacterium chitinilyticum]